ncbi:MAG: UDP-N-acetyl-D-mannosamine dehydrogenase [Alkalispirochaetaceae bacterium]
MKDDLRITVVGLGYIGLPTAALLANRGYRVHGIDVLENVVDTINQGKIHIVEPDLDSFVRSAVGSGKLTAHRDVQEADVFIIAVPTPLTENREPRMDYVWDAARAIAAKLVAGNLVVLESTSPVGTTERIAEIIREEAPGVTPIHVAHCPERVLPGRIMIELSENDRIVGGTSEKATREVAEFYRNFVVGDVLETTARTAEMTKLVENASRDVQIAFANELSMISDRYDVNVWDVIDLANHHPRVNILKPGPGVGGHCIAVDPWFIVHSAPEDTRLIRAARERNLDKSEWVIEKIEEEVTRLSESGGGKPKIGVMGLAYKPDIDDLRESPALYIARALKGRKHVVVACEPNLDRHGEFELRSPEETVAEADLIVYLVAHRPFRELDTRELPVLDFCGVTRG